MLTSTISAAGIFYKAIGSGANYVLMCAQRDIDDVDHDDNTKEVVPCNETISYNLITNNWTTNSVTFKYLLFCCLLSLRCIVYFLRCGRRHRASRED